MRWHVLSADGDLPATVYPLDDLRDHEPDSKECWCRPREMDGVLVHNSMDERESYERGRKVQ